MSVFKAVIWCCLFLFMYCLEAQAFTCSTSAVTTPDVSTVQSNTCTQYSSLPGSPFSACNGNTNTLVTINTTTYPNALSNDGSAGVFIYRAGIGPDAPGTTGKKWIIYLQGGGLVYNNTTCASRPINLYSSTYWTGGGQSIINGAVNPNEGILSPWSGTNPNFWTANVVLGLYTSSDYHSGTTKGTGAFNIANCSTWDFEGQAMTAAMIQTLISTYGLSSGDSVVMAGDSAGGVGTTFLCDYIQGLMPSGVRYLCTADSGLFDATYGAYSAGASAPAYVSTASPTSIQTVQTLGDALWGVSYPDTGTIINNGSLTAPMFSIGSIQDEVILSQFENIGDKALGSPPRQTSELPYITYFSQDLLTLMQSAQTASTNGAGYQPYSFFTINTPGHGWSNYNAWNIPVSDTAGNVTSMASTFYNWYLNPCAQPAGVETDAGALFNLSSFNPQITAAYARH
jgi:hypothetical protein